MAQKDTTPRRDDQQKSGDESQGYGNRQQQEDMRRGRSLDQDAPPHSGQNRGNRAGNEADDNEADDQDQESREDREDREDDL